MSVYKKLKDFDSTGGAHPNSGLIQLRNGKLYGTAPRGGSSDYGVIFTFDPSTSVYPRGNVFNSVGYPTGSLIQ